MEKLKVGDVAPDFTGITQDGKTVSLSDYSNTKLILYFYPKDSTPGCTLEACSLRDGRDELRKIGFEIIGVSGDTEKKHQSFISKHSLNFDLIADIDHVVSEQYGVWGLKKFMGREYMGIARTTFIIADGKIEKVFDKVKTASHFEQILDSYK